MKRPVVAAAVAVIVLAACGSSGGSNASGGSSAGTPPAPSVGSATSAPSASASASPASAVTGPCANDYFPVVAGATWTYRHMVAGSTATGRQTLRAIGDRGFTTVTTSSQGSERDSWTCSSAGLADVEQHVSGSGGSITFGGQTFQTGVQNFHDYRSRGVTIPASMHARATWIQVVSSHAVFPLAGVDYPETQVVTTSSRVLGVGRVTSPAGTFQCLKIQVTTSTRKTIPSLGQDLTSVSHGTIWVARGVGIVQSVTINASGFRIATLLLAYHIP